MPTASRSLGCTNPTLGFTTADVNTAYYAARSAIAATVFRLLDLHKLGSGRAAAWNDSGFSCWFGAYSEKRFSTVIDKMIEIYGILRDYRLKIECTKRDLYGAANPNIMKIKLGLKWVGDPLERAQTFIHEASHIAGVVSGKEGSFYGVSAILSMAQKKPNAVVRMSDAYGYAAVDSSPGIGCM